MVFIVLFVEEFSVHIDKLGIRYHPGGRQASHVDIILLCAGTIITDFIQTCVGTTSKVEQIVFIFPSLPGRGVLDI